MAVKIDGKTGRITWSGFADGIGPSPHGGIADIKGANISSVKGEISVAYARARVDQAQVSAATMTNSGSSTTFAYAGTLTSGTWIKINSHTGSPGTTDNNYYFVKPVVAGVSYNLYSDFGVTIITSGGGASTINFTTLTMGAPMDYCIEQHGGAASNAFRYFVFDMNGVIWVSGTSGTPGASGTPSTTMTWSAITPHGTTISDIPTFSIPNGSLQVMYATDSNNKITANYLMIFTDSQILYGKNSDNSGWPSITGAAFTAFQTFNYSGGYYHKAILANDQVMYFTDGPGVGIIQQKTGQQFNPGSSATYNYVNANYLMAPNDAATRISTIPAGNGLSIVVGGQQNNLYIYPTYQNSTATGAAPTSILWMPESNTQYLIQANNFVIVFCGNKGNIYLTNGSSVVPLLTVPDYIAGSVNFTQDPYFVWGGAMYLRGRIFFSIKDQTSTHTGNCGGVWSFVPSFSYYPDQDAGLSLRMENASSLYSTKGFNGYAPVVFAGAEITAQQNNGPQYVACWTQGDNNGANTVNSIDFSATTPLTDGSTIYETEAVPVGHFVDSQTYQNIDIKFAANLVAGESIVVNYRTDLEQAWASAGTVLTEPATSGNGSPLARTISVLPFQNVQLIQLQVILTSTASNPSWCRLKEISII